jgi:predicted AAA+ superfamily ATPase
MTHNWYDIIQPHADIRKGNFDEAIFAADIGDVVVGKAPADYNDPYLFYKKTYLTAGLKGLLQKASNKLSNGAGASVVQIKTPFGGGKTHALVALYHYLQSGRQIKELLPPGLDILQPRMSVINGEHFNPVEGRTSDGVTRYTFWGEIAYQIGGRAGYEQFRANDESRVSPGKEKLRDFLAAHQPVVLLFDEIL